MVGLSVASSVKGFYYMDLQHGYYISCWPFLSSLSFKTCYSLHLHSSFLTLCLQNSTEKKEEEKVIFASDDSDLESCFKNGVKKVKTFKKYELRTFRKLYHVTVIFVFHISTRKHGCSLFVNHMSTNLKSCVYLILLRVSALGFWIKLFHNFEQF